MGDFVAWVKDQVRKSHLKELIMTHTGLTPPVFIAAVALATAGTALTVSAVSFLLAPPKKDDRSLDVIVEEEIMPYTPVNQRDVDVVPVFLETPIVEVTKKEEEEEEAPSNDVEVPVKEEVEAPAEEEEVTAPTTEDGEDGISSGFVAVEETIA